MHAYKFYYRIFSCISRFVYKSAPVFQAKNNDIFENSCIYKLTPMIDEYTKQNKIEGIKDKKQ